MHTLSFCAVLVPVLGAALLLALVLVASAVPKYDAACRYVAVVFVAQFGAMFFRVACVLRKSPRRSCQSQTRLPESPSTATLDKFAIPLAEEVLKLAILTLAARVAADCVSMASYLLVVGAVFACNKLVALLVTFSPLGCKKKYARFLKSYDVFESRFVCISDNASVGSTSNSHVSENRTLVLQSSDDVPELPFKLDLFASPNEAATSIPIPGSADSPAAHLRMIDRLYAVSPKDTMYLTYAKFVGPSEGVPGVSEDVSVLDFEQRQPSVVEGGAAQTPEMHLATFPDKEDHAPFACVNSSSTRVPSCLYFTSQNYWFAWLLPCLNGKNRRGRSQQKRERALIKKKLSTYTLNSDTHSAYSMLPTILGEYETSSLKLAWSGALYGAIDLESQSLQARVANSQTFYEYARFANQYLDPWMCNLHEILRCIDPAFTKFGVVLPHLPVFFFVLYSAGAFMWQISSAIILATPFLAHSGPPCVIVLAFTMLAISKLFCVNFLHGQCRYSYKFSILAEFILNILLFTLAYVWLRLSVSVG